MSRQDDLALIARLMRRYRAYIVAPAILVTASTLFAVLIAPGPRALGPGGDRAPRTVKRERPDHG